MKSFTISLLIGACLCGSAIAQAPQPATQEQRQEILKKLDWKEGGEFALSSSQSNLSVDKKYGVLTGADARTFLETVNGLRMPDNIEALIVDPDVDGGVQYRYVQEGYVSLEDWDDVNADRMLQEMKEGTESSNKERIQHGMKALHVKNWGSPPHLDRATQTVHWSLIAEEDGGEPVINAVALKLGRRGYEKITGMAGDAATAESILKVGMDAFRYQAGASYADFQKGDKVAEYGIAALVAAGVGAKVAAKLGLIGLLLVFLKKAWVVLLLIPALFKRALRKLTGKEAPAVTSSETVAAETVAAEPAPPTEPPAQ